MKSYELVIGVILVVAGGVMLGVDAMSAAQEGGPDPNTRQETVSACDDFIKSDAGAGLACCPDPDGQHATPFDPNTQCCLSAGSVITRPPQSMGCCPP